ncbi:chromate transporter [Sphaerotilus sulfidivorans]|uniref:Chromate transporter n=1 Tax=Sphaerotilus sulfidivorans TaxID=639200 RepID=A0ABV2IKD7_9BURK
MPDIVRPASPWALFVAFSLLALQGFGGVIAIAQRVVVEQRRWLTKTEFLELLAAGQVLPGPNVVNLSLMIGDRFFGWRGALAAMGGMILPPMAVVLAATVLYGRLAPDLPALAGALRGMGAVSAGMILATGLKLMGGLAKQPLGRRVGLVYAGMTALAVGALRWPMAAVVLGLGSVAVLHAAWVIRRAEGQR